MAIGFHFDDIEESYFGFNEKELPPIGAPYHDNDEMDEKELPPICAPYHD